MEQIHHSEKRNEISLEECATNLIDTYKEVVGKKGTSERDAQQWRDYITRFSPDVGLTVISNNGKKYHLAIETKAGAVKLISYHKTQQQYNLEMYPAVETQRR